MNEFELVLLGALLHDIGKFRERTFDPLPVWAAGFLQGLWVNWRKAGWVALETAMAGVLVLVFSVSLLDYAYHQERQQMERAIALRGLR